MADFTHFTPSPTWGRSGALRRRPAFSLSNVVLRLWVLLWRDLSANRRVPSRTRNWNAHIGFHAKFRTMKDISLGVFDLLVPLADGAVAPLCPWLGGGAKSGF